MNQNLPFDYAISIADNNMKKYSPLGQDYEKFADNKNSDLMNRAKNDEEDQKEEELKNTNSSQIIKLSGNNSLEEDRNLINVGGDEDIINFKKELQSKNFNMLSEKEINILIEEIYKQINSIQKKANDSNSIYTKPYFDKEINYLLNNVKKLERLQKSFYPNNMPTQGTFDFSGDKLDITQINNFVGNKEKKNSWKYIGQKEDLLKNTNFTSKNHASLNAEVSLITKKSEYNSHIEYRKYYQDLFIKVIKCSIDSVSILINVRAKSEYGHELNYIYIKKIYELDIYNYKEFLESTIMDIYLGKFLIINHEEKDKIKKWIYSLLYAEKLNELEKIKLLNELFSKTIKEILLLYINDDPYIQIENKNVVKFYLKRFKTFRDDFNEYTLDEKKLIKDYILSLLDNKISNINYEKNDKQSGNDKLSKEENEKTDNKVLNNNTTKLKKRQKQKQNIPKGQDNERRKMMRVGLKSFHSTLEKMVEKYVKRNLHKITIEKQIGNSPKNYFDFCKKSIYNVYKQSLPRKLNKECKEDNSKYTYNIDIIHEAIEKEKIYEKEDDRILHKIFNKSVSVKDILDVFLEVKDKIEIKGEKDIYIEGFIKYKDFYNDKYDKKKIEFNKKDLSDVMEGKGQKRGSNTERNRKLRGNKNLGRKRKKE